MKWRVNPPAAVTEFQPAGDAILVLSDHAAPHQRPALQELQAMQQAVIQATRSVEVEELEVVTSAELYSLTRSQNAAQAAEQKLRSLIESSHIIDTDYMDRYSTAATAEEAARSAYLDRWRDLFD